MPPPRRRAGVPEPAPAERFARLFQPGLIRNARVEPRWLDGGASFWYEREEQGGRHAYLVETATGAKRALDRPPEPSTASGAAPRFIRHAFLAGFPDVMEVPSPDGRWFATERDSNVWLRSALDGREVPLTEGGTESWPWEVEGGTWSPDSLRIALQRVDRRHVTRRPLVHWLKDDEEVEWVRHTKAGGRLEHPVLHLVDIRSGEAMPVDAGPDPETKLYPVMWLPDRDELLCFKTNRFLNPLSVVAVDGATASPRELVDERVPTFISFGDYLTRFTPLPSGTGFVWKSERDGWAHLYRYDMEGHLVGRLTSGEFPVVGVAAVDEPGGWLYYLAHAEPRLYDTHLYRRRLDGSGKPKRLTSAPGQHAPAFSPDFAHYVDNHSSVDRPPEAELRRSDGKLVARLGRADVSALAAAAPGEPEEFIATAADGVTPIHGVLFHPPGLQRRRRYPVVEAIYGGPQHGQVPRAYDDARAVLPRALAALGFVVFVVDGRGTPDRSKAFHDVVHRSFGVNEIPDHAAALRQVARERPYMDLSRVGVVGGSWGGYFTIRALLTEPELYRVGVAIAPAVDLYDHLAQAIEPFMGRPRDNREGYERASNLALADRLQGKLLLIHGTSDVNATFSATMKMTHALMRAGKPYDLIVLTDEHHHPQGPAQAYYLDAVRRYFTDHLNPGS